MTIFLLVASLYWVLKIIVAKAGHQNTLNKHFNPFNQLTKLYIMHNITRRVFINNILNQLHSFIFSFQR